MAWVGREHTCSRCRGMVFYYRRMNWGAPTLCHSDPRTGRILPHRCWPQASLDTLNETGAHVALRRPYSRSPEPGGTKTPPVSRKPLHGAIAYGNPNATARGG